MKTLLAASIILACACGAEDDEGERLLDISVCGPLKLNRFLEQHWTPGKLRNLEMYCKLTLADFCIENLVDRHLLPQQRHGWQPENHDGTIRSGRSAAMLEAMLAIKMPGVWFETVCDDLLAIQENARKAVDAYRTRVIQAAKKNEPTLEALKKNYQGKIKTWKMLQSRNEHCTMDEGLKSVLALLDLFAEWFPLGQKLSDLEEIIGERSLKYEAFWQYCFPAHINGFSIILIVKDGIITGVFCVHGAY